MVKSPSFFLYLLLGLISIQMAGAGGGKLLYVAPFSHSMGALHFGEAATRLIGLLEVLAAVGVWWPRGRVLALLGLLPLMAGGIAAHLAAGQPWTACLPAALGLGLQLTALRLLHSRAFHFSLLPPTSSSQSV